MAFDLDDCAVKADAFTGDHVERLDLPAFLLGIADVHAIQHLRPILGLEAALTGIDRKDRIAFVHFPGKPGVDFESLQHGGKPLERRILFFGERGVFSGKLGGSPSILKRGNRLFVAFDGVAQGTGLTGDLLRARRVIPEVGRSDLLVEFFEAPGLLVYMKPYARICHALRRRFDFFGFSLCHCYLSRP